MPIFQGWANVLFKWTFRSCVHFRSLKMNVLFFTFFFWFKNERSIHFLNIPFDFQVFFGHFGGQKWFHKSPKTRKSSETFEKWRNVHLRSFPFIFLNIIFLGGFISRQKLEKWTEMNVPIKKWTELNGTFKNGKERMPNLAEYWISAPRVAGGAL